MLKSLGCLLKEDMLDKLCIARLTVSWEEAGHLKTLYFL